MWSVALSIDATSCLREQLSVRESATGRLGGMDKAREDQTDRLREKVKRRSDSEDEKMRLRQRMKMRN